MIIFYIHLKLFLTADLKRTIKEPAHEIMVLITFATSEGSGEPAHPRGLAKAFAVRVGPKIRHLAIPDDCACAFKERFTEDEKYHNLMRWLKRSPGRDTIKDHSPRWPH